MHLMIIYQTTTFVFRKCFKMYGHCGSFFVILNTTAAMEIALFWNMTPCSLVEI